MYEYDFKNNGRYADSVRIYIDDEFDQFYMPEGRWPYYRLRGKPVAPEDAIRIIAKTDDVFSFEYGLKGSIGSSFLRMSYFPRAHTFNEYHGWVHPNGIIAQNLCSGIKLPTLDEILADLVRIAAEFPYLDMIIAVSTWSELSPVCWNMLGENDAYKYYDDEDFAESLEMGIWVHNGVIDVVKPKLAAELYGEYDKLYDGIDKRIFFPDYYRDFAMDRIGRDFLRKCLNVYGIDSVNEFVEDGRRRGKAFCGLSESDKDMMRYMSL